ncbi:copper resistance protein B [Oceanobacter sp. 5_MG-2023]|uniref:copper resistance protein B n=1 Tax=Oceanobacter sp. 5_MG-2023 TaxID=3062645 RepID=UPI0026E24F9F|nr:copper resistance protein B [Oceanobacter sp. 5_MG-2023]MDO6681775.1 copper resistance protein B [Oceanobacter sp. 5_MG-2023]
MTWAETHTMMSGMECQESDAHCAHHQGTDHSQMSHDEMNIQGGTAPADARDPHAYSGGYTLTSGPYARSGDRQLRLADEHHFSALIIDQFEWAQHDGSTSSRLGGEYWYGTTWDRAVVQLDGEHQQGDTEAELGLYWRHAVTAFWNTQLGVRYDTTPGRSRYWVGAGFQGLAPYWLESQAMVFVSEQGITRLELETEYDLLLTQRWILGLEGKLTAAGKRDPQDTFAQGLNDTQFSGRFRYEFSRQFAPYVGVERRHVYGATADILGESAATEWLLGVKAWF